MSLFACPCIFEYCCLDVFNMQPNGAAESCRKTGAPTLKWQARGNGCCEGCCCCFGGKDNDCCCVVEPGVCNIFNNTCIPPYRTAEKYSIGISRKGYWAKRFLQESMNENHVEGTFVLCQQSDSEKEITRGIHILNSAIEKEAKQRSLDKKKIDGISEKRDILLMKMVELCTPFSKYYYRQSVLKLFNASIEVQPNNKEAVEKLIKNRELLLNTILKENSTTYCMVKLTTGIEIFNSAIENTSKFLSQYDELILSLSNSRAKLFDKLFELASNNSRLYSLESYSKILHNTIRQISELSTPPLEKRNYYKRFSDDLLTKAFTICSKSPSERDLVISVEMFESRIEIESKFFKDNEGTIEKLVEKRDQLLYKTSEKCSKSQFPQEIEIAIKLFDNLKKKYSNAPPLDITRVPSLIDGKMLMEIQLQKIAPKKEPTRARRVVRHTPTPQEEQEKLIQDMKKKTEDLEWRIGQIVATRENLYRMTNRG